MVQEFQVLRCCHCETFQVQIVKKNNAKFECKMCHEKQSVKQVYFTSASAGDCRSAVMELNAARGRVIDGNCTSTKAADNTRREVGVNITVDLDKLSIDPFIVVF